MARKIDKSDFSVKTFRARDIRRPNKARKVKAPHDETNVAVSALIMHYLTIILRAQTFFERMCSRVDLFYQRLA